MQRSNLDWALAHYGAQKLLDAKGRDLRTPLHFAITNNDPDLIDELLDLGGWVRPEEGGGQEGGGGMCPLLPVAAVLLEPSFFPADPLPAS